eukprot:TRINITY_DN40438_c0_g1_i2.p1 TRINITY_DN40438_c0_g1~~TRINITY_DN40438_c0_g1_i2.p1  ORF type:complete len:145 (-),score=37.00 TRINITY_DN40438_c0_g1_i2:8-442(-)
MCIRDRACVELSQINKIALPSIIMLLARFAIELTDVSILGQLSTDSLAAAAFALVYINLTCAVVWRGVGGALTTLSSQAYGAGNYELMAEWGQLATGLVVVVSIPIGASWLLIPTCLLYTSDAADEEDSVEFGWRRIIKNNTSQ